MKRFVFFCLAGTSLLMNACYPEGPETIDELDVVVTSRDNQFDFANVNTYVLIDSVVQVQDPNNPNNNVQLPIEWNQLMLERVAANLNNLGYTPLDTTVAGQTPDVLVQVSLIATTNTDVYYDYYPNYWGWYGGWGGFYPGFGTGFYPGGLTTAYAYSYDVGTLNVDMLNVRNTPTPGSDTQIPLVWTGAVRGILEGNAADVQERLITGIDKAFQQSPYLAGGQ